MENNCNKIKDTCGTKNFAPCISYQTNLPTFSKITGCTNLDETTTELYTLVGEIKLQSDLSELGSKCLTYVLDTNGKKNVKNILLKYEQEICDLKMEVTKLKNRQICDIPIIDCLTTLGCLALPCSTSIVTLGDWMKAVQLKICTTAPTIIT